MAETPSPGVSCPNCGYSLRGLAGVDVVCPECGIHLDVAELIRHRPLDRLDNPVYRRAARPAIMLACGLALFAVMLFIVGGYRPDSLWINGFAMAVLIAWMIPLAIALATMHGSFIWLTFLLHLVYVGIVIGVLGGVAWFILDVIRCTQSIAASDMTGAIRQAIGSMVAAVIAIVSLSILRRLDRHIGRRCLRLLLTDGRYSY